MTNLRHNYYLFCQFVLLFTSYHLTTISSKNKVKNYSDDLFSNLSKLKLASFSLSQFLSTYHRVYYLHLIHLSIQMQNILILKTVSRNPH